jgi:predicted RNA binding protein YcfA (HicA-like mRNA interferase family)
VPLPTDEESFVAPLDLEYAETSTVKPREVIRFLERNGFRLDHAPSDHSVYSHPALKRCAAVPEHNRDMPKDTLLSLLGAAGCTREDLLAFYREDNLFLDIPVASRSAQIPVATASTTSTTFARSPTNLTASPLPPRIEVSQ